ncbi:hypothetical protein B5M47_02875 [candidate division CPR3 bacterium 4484_211]|uniref:Membrane protein 6-pyruvoyl-tetrahydropterin synthase-related domain-containing protein n=1 Tax=candidate division CPR3 bacterium 4484_211 TaxID=1968527 RepID=A0A1W9NXX8_UNCC3|nr:MAG: hypothetical protein B5M47_02875 [candidate division CPR3 bacterium 4484_211]
MRKLLLPAILFFAALALICPALNSNLRIYPYSFEGSWLSQIRFVVDNWPHIWWNPNWFLGYPLRFSQNPLFIGGLSLVAKVGRADIFFLYRLMTAGALCFFPLVFYGFLRTVKFRKTYAFVSALWLILAPSLMYIFPPVRYLGGRTGYLPFVFFSSLFLGNGPKAAALPLGLLALIVYRKFLKENTRCCLLGTVLLAACALLIGSSAVVFLIVGGLCLLFLEILGDQQNWQDYLLRALTVFICCLLTVSLWYTPFYWWHALRNPSLAGKSLVSVMVNLVKFMIVLLPLLLGAWVVRGSSWLRDKRVAFVLFFNFGFWFLTLSRFIADTDFWQDYAAYGVEVDMGSAMLVGLLVERLLEIIADKVKSLELKIKNYRAKFKSVPVPQILNFLAFSLPLSAGCLLVLVYHLRLNNSCKTYGIYYGDSFEYRISDFLKKNVAPTERVFTSGSLVFWLNYFAPCVMQVRGGDDPAAVHPYWAHGAYQIREGESPDLAALWLESLGASWVVVNTSQSADPYHDFRHPDKFGLMKGWQKVYDQDGNKIYRKKDDLFARAVDWKETKILSSPLSGIDEKNLKAYINWRNRLAGLTAKGWYSSNQAIVLMTSPPLSNAISLGVAFNHGWQAKPVSDSGGIEVHPDVLGNLGALMKGQEGKADILLFYRLSVVDWGLGLVLFCAGLGLVFLYPRTFDWVKFLMAKLDIMNEDDY